VQNFVPSLCTRWVNEAYARPLWVIFRPRTASELGLFIPQQRTSGDRNGMSVSCQNRKSAPQRKCAAPPIYSRSAFLIARSTSEAKIL
jgi:hypothetical protein